MYSARVRSHLPEEEVQKTFDALVDNLRQHQLDKVEELLAIVPPADARQIFLHTSNEGETILHTAVKFRCPPDIITRILGLYPELIVASREESALYKGQTALHIAITDGNSTLTKCLLDKAQEIGYSNLNDLLHKCATGSKFENTVMLGELPLIVAALTLNTEIMDTLIQNGTRLESHNSSGDNVVHSLIRYAFLYPEKVDGVLKIFEYISKIANSSVMSFDHPADIDTVFDKNKIKSTIQIWISKNNDSMNPLQLSAYYGQHAIFKFIMELKGVYCYVNSEDGLFDVELYDVTDIDTIQTKKTTKVDHCDKNENKTPMCLPGSLDLTESDDIYKTPTLEMMFNAQPGVVFNFIEMTPLRYVISRKWKFYRWFYAIWGFIHMLFMIGFTVYAIRRSDVDVVQQNNGKVYNRRRVVGEAGFETFYVVLTIIVAIIYFAQEVIRMIKGEMAWSMSHVMNSFHNGPFRLVLLSFSVLAFADSIWAISDSNYRDYLLVFAMILGWWFLVFFLRGLRNFSFFTVMIQKVLVGDMFRFSIIISMELIAFTAGLFIAFRGSITDNTDVYSYGKLTLLMFQMMFGFTNLDVLFDTRDAWFAVCLYVTFVILTYVLMINSLIAMMSNTCNVVSQNREIQYRVQQLSIILFFESMFPMAWKRLAGSPRMCNWYDSNTNTFTKRKRYFMEVRSLHEVTKSKRRHRLNPETMLETIFHTVQKMHLPEVLNAMETPVELVRDAFDSAPRPPVNATPEQHTLGRALYPREDKPVPETDGAASHKKKKKRKHRHRDRPEDEPTKTLPSTEHGDQDSVE